MGKPRSKYRLSQPTKRVVILLLAVSAASYFLLPEEDGPVYPEVVVGSGYSGSKLDDFYISSLEEDITRWRGGGRRGRGGGEFHWGTEFVVHATVMSENSGGGACRLSASLITDGDERPFSATFASGNNAGMIISSEEPAGVRLEESEIRKDATLRLDRLSCSDQYSDGVPAPFDDRARSPSR